MTNKPTIRDKTNYVNRKIKEQNGLKNSDTLAYQYIYDLTSYLTRKNINFVKHSSDIPEEFVQNIVIQIFRRFSCDILKKKKKDANLSSIFPYITRCVLTESVKLKTVVYSRTRPRPGDDMKDQLFEKKDFLYDPTFETQTIIRIERKIKNIVTGAAKGLHKNAVMVENRNLLLFPLVLCVCRRDLSLFKDSSKELKKIMKTLYFELQDPVKRLKI